MGSATASDMGRSFGSLDRCEMDTQTDDLSGGILPLSILVSRQLRRFRTTNAPVRNIFRIPPAGRHPSRLLFRLLSDFDGIYFPANGRRTADQRSTRRLCSAFPDFLWLQPSKLPGPTPDWNSLNETIRIDHCRASAMSYSGKQRSGTHDSFLDVSGPVKSIEMTVADSYPISQRDPLPGDCIESVKFTDSPPTLSRTRSLNFSLPSWACYLLAFRPIPTVGTHCVGVYSTRYGPATCRALRAVGGVL